jgi:DNA modification methylase
VSITLLEGDCRETLPLLPRRSVQCCVTSPPFYGLRDYGTPPLVWSGDSVHPVHKWGGRQPAPGWQSKNGTGLSTLTELAGGGGQTRAEVHSTTADKSGGSFCACGAWLGSLGLEPTPELYIEHLVDVFREVRDVLRDDGTLWLNLGDSYAGSGKGPSQSLQPLASTVQRIGPQPHTIGVGRQGDYKPKDLMLMPFRVAMALQADGWYLRSVIPWLKRNSMPESVTDRPATSLEYVFLLAKSKTYYWDADAVRTRDGEPTRRAASFRNDGPYTGNRSFDNSADNSKQTHGDGPVSLNGRNRRNSDWFFESWQGLMLDEQDDPLALLVNPTAYKGSHYATFPPKLVEPMVKASTSERGQCPECGAPWVRVTTNEGYTESTSHNHFSTPYHDETSHQTNRASKLTADGFIPNRNRLTATTGWRPSCAHDAPPVPQTVLDPFAGAGTVGLVADRLGRDAVLCELSSNYGDQAGRRLVDDAPLLVEFQRKESVV